MNIVHDYPPNIDVIRKQFGITGEHVVFTFGDILYNPSGDTIPDHLLVHEQVHTKQQGLDVSGWWNRYLADNQFRLQQEVEAYRAQYQFALQNLNRIYRRLLLKKIAKDLSGPMYGKLVSSQQAEQLIKQS